MRERGLPVGVKEGKVKKAKIEITGVTDGEETRMETVGEYKWDTDTHWIAYTDYVGNSITRSGIYARNDAMLLHRAGAIAGDMLFTPRFDTLSRYSAFAVETDFVVHTHRYEVKATDSRVEIGLNYTLTDKDYRHPIHAMLRIVVELHG